MHGKTKKMPEKRENFVKTSVARFVFGKTYQNWGKYTKLQQTLPKWP
jgi:hypothetical protein